MRCNSCGGTYQSVQADGMDYYHACAPLAPTDQHPTGAEHPKKRDENLVPHPSLFVLADGREVGADELPTNGAAYRRKMTLKSHGLGAAPIPEPPTAPQKR